MAELTVPQLAERLDVSVRHARRLVDSGRFAARQLPSGEWLIDNDSVIRYEKRRAPDGRPLDADTAWALLYELSGVNASHLVSSATYARLRRRIRDMGPEGIAIAVAGRSNTHRFRSANARKAQADLVSTGRAASNLLDTDLLPDDRRVSGYVPVGTTITDYALTHFMVSDHTGPDTLYENTAPGGLTEPLTGVVAADLALSTDTRESSAGIHALGRLKDPWLAAHTR